MYEHPRSSNFESELSTIQGEIERITFHNDETEFTVARLRVPGHRDLVTVVGTMMAPTPGQVVRASGQWKSHPEHGEQFQIRQYTTILPATASGIEKYLGSGLVKGIGPVMAGEWSRSSASILWTLSSVRRQRKWESGLGVFSRELVALRLERS